MTWPSDSTITSELGPRLMEAFSLRDRASLIAAKHSLIMATWVLLGRNQGRRIIKDASAHLGGVLRRTDSPPDKQKWCGRHRCWVQGPL